MRLPGVLAAGVEQRVGDLDLHHRPAPRDGNRNRARPDPGSMPWKTAFSTSGWSRKAAPAPHRPTRRAARPPAGARPGAGLEAQVALAQGDLVGERDQLAVVLHQRAEQVGQLFQPSSARRGLARSTPSTPFRLLNRKCGRIRAVSASRRASASTAGHGPRHGWQNTPATPAAASVNPPAGGRPPRPGQQAMLSSAPRHHRHRQPARHRGGAGQPAGWSRKRRHRTGSAETPPVPPCPTIAEPASIIGIAHQHRHHRQGIDEHQDAQHDAQVAESAAPGLPPPPRRAAGFAL